MRCEDVQARYLAGEGSPLLDSHFAGCPTCRVERPGLDMLRRALADSVTWETPSPDLERLVVDEVARQRLPKVQARSRRWMMAVASLAAVVVGVVAIATFALGRPDWSTELVASDVTPRATASVAGWLTDEGTRMRFDIAGLPAAGPDEYYEIWLTAPDGTHVSAGSFRQNGVIEASIGVARSDYPRVWITLEGTDDDLGPSGVTVLDDPDA